MKITIWTDNGANCQSQIKETLDIEDIGVTEEEWKSFNDDQKDRTIREYWLDREAFQYGWDDGE